MSQGPDWWVKIGDFGISKRVLEGLTGLQTLNGTPAFTAPEVYQQIWNARENKLNNMDFTPEVDIWSLGVISYYMLTGKLPFSGQSDLFSYCKEETSLPLECMAEQNTTPEASLFLKKTLAANPAYRPEAKDLLDHTWLIPLLQESDPEEERLNSSTSPTDESMIPQPLQIQSPHSSQDVMLQGTINLPVPNPPTVPKLPLPSPTSLGIDGDTYKHIVASAAPLLNPNHPAMHPDIDIISSIQSHSHSESGHNEPSARRQHTKQPSQLSDMSPGDSLPPYTRRRSDAAPIPISDLTYQTPKSGSPASSVRNSSDRFSKKFRRVSRDMVPKRSRHSRDHGRENNKEMEKAKEKEVDSPKSPARYDFVSDIDKALLMGHSSNSKTKSRIVEIPGRPQFAEGLPMFPMRTKKV